MSLVDLVLCSGSIILAVFCPFYCTSFHLNLLGYSQSISQFSVFFCVSLILWYLLSRVSYAFFSDFKISWSEMNLEVSLRIDLARFGPFLCTSCYLTPFYYFHFISEVFCLASHFISLFSCLLISFCSLVLRFLCI